MAAYVAHNISCAPLRDEQYSVSDRGGIGDEPRTSSSTIVARYLQPIFPLFGRRLRRRLRPTIAAQRLTMDKVQREGGTRLVSTPSSFVIFNRFFLVPVDEETRFSRDP